MKTFRDYLTESESVADTPVPGDAFDIELAPDQLIESVVLEVSDDTIVITADAAAIAMLEGCGHLTEDIKRYGPSGSNNSIGHSLSEQTVDEGCGCNDMPTADPGEYGEEGDMAKNELLTIVRAAQKLTGMLDNNDDMPEWTQKKINKAADYVDTAADYIASQKQRGIMERFAKDPGPLDLSANPTKSQVWARYMSIYDYEGYQGEENSQEMQDLEDYAARRFGQDMVNDMISAGYQSYFGRSDNPRKPIDQGTGNYTSLARSAISAADVKKDGKLTKRATANTKQRVADRLGKHPEPNLPESSEEKESSPVARAVLHRIMMQHPGVLATHGPERVMAAVDELADRVNIGPDDEIGTSDVSGWVRDVIRMLAELPDEPMNVVDALEEGEIDDTWMNDRHREFYKRNPHFKRNDRERVEVGRGTQLATRVKPSVKPAQVQKKPTTRFGIAEGAGIHDILKQYPQEVAQFQQGGELDTDLESALWDYYYNRGEIRNYNAAASEYIARQLANELGLSEANAASNDPLLAKAIDLAPIGAIGEAEYQGRDVPLGKPMRGDVKKFKVYVKDPKTGNVKKVNFGHGGTSAKRAGQKTMKIKKSDPARRKSFRARHNCDNPGPRTKARYWSCRAW